MNDLFSSEAREARRAAERRAREPKAKLLVSYFALAAERVLLPSGEELLRCKCPRCGNRFDLVGSPQTGEPLSGAGYGLEEDADE